jgi:hypothetical protein
MLSKPATTRGNSCEIIQEIYGFGAHYLLREDEEQVCQRMIAKYQRRGSDSKDTANFELSVRRAISYRKQELAIGTFQKKSLLSSASRAARGTADKDGGDSFLASRKIHLG